MRPNIVEYWMGLAKGVAARGTCPRRQVGCIITDSIGQILASGYNGAPRGIDNCIDVPCGAQEAVSGDSDTCYAIHAEANAILQLRERLNEACILYSTTLPCFSCAKLICQTSIKCVYVLEDYADQRGKDLLLKRGIIVNYVKS